MGILDGLITGARHGYVGAQQGKMLAEDRQRERSEFERKALHDALARRLMEAQITKAQAPAPARWHYDAERGVQVNEDSGEVRVPQGLPARPEPAAQRPNTSIVQTPDGPIVVKEGETTGTPVTVNGQRVPGTQRNQPRQSPGIVQKVAANRRSIQMVQDAINSIKTNPAAIGLIGYLPDAILSRIDPSGVKTRADIGDVSSGIIHDRFGSAVTRTELERGKFIPTEKDPPAAAIEKLERLLKYLWQETEFLASTPVKDTEGNEVAPASEAGPTGPSSKARAAAAAALARRKG